MTAAAFAAIAATLYAAHHLADHVFGQTDKQAANKAAAGWYGWRNLLGHVVAYHTLMVGMLVTAISVLDLPVTVTGTIVGVAFSAITHAFLDRRWPVRWHGHGKVAECLSCSPG